jgi:TRAP-type C4-dicarboxylate transport system permease small subunit
MKWSEVVAPPSEKLLRQFAALFLVFFLGLVGWRAWQGHRDAWAAPVAVIALLVGVIGLIRPSAVRFIYTGWMIVAFPIGWTVSRAALAIVFFALFTPVALLFRLVRRDELQLRHPDQRGPYWRPKSTPEDVREYFRQS